MDNEPSTNEAAAGQDSASMPRPEEMGRNVLGSGEAIEPEATHATKDAAVRTGDRMWGPAGVPPTDEPT